MGENFAVIATQKDEVEKKLQDTCYLVDQEIEGKNDIANKIKDIDVTVHNAKHDLEELEDALLKLTREKETKDHNIRVINDEIAFQEEVLTKYTKDKKFLQEENAKNADEFGSVEDRASHLNKVKSKLEGTIDELNLALGDEHNKKAVIEHNRRKAEGDLRILMESVSDLERSKKDLESMIFKKEAEVSLLASKHEDEQVDGARVGKNIKDLQIKIDELEDEMKCENQARMKAENSRLKLEAKYNEMMDRLDEAGSATAAQNELFKKREAEASKLRRDIETDNIQHDAAVAAFRKKHNDAVAEMSEQIDHLTKMKQKIDKEKEIMKRKGEELKSHFDRLTIDKAHSEKQGKNLQAQILEVQAKYDECYRCIGDYENNKKKISSENTDLVRQLEDLEAQIHSLSKLTITYGAQLSDMQNAAKVENRDRVSILNKYRNLEHDFEGLQEQLHEDAETKHALGRDLAKANAEALMYRSKYENEGIVRAEELEVAGLKLASALEEAEQQIEQLKYKNAALEKVKARISGELEAMHKDTENSQALAASAEKKQRTFEKIIGEWKIKVDELAHDLDVSQQDARNHSAELFKMKAKYDEGMEQLDNITRENKVLGEDVRDLMDQMCEGSKNMNEMAKAVKKYEAEKDDLQ